MKNTKTQLFKQRLFRMHIALGIFFSSFIYISIFFGVFTIFLPYIKTWEKPSRYIEKVNITNVDYNNMIEQVSKNPEFPKDNILINLPGNMGDPAVVITHRFAALELVDRVIVLNNGKIVADGPKDKVLAALQQKG